MRCDCRTACARFREEDIWVHRGTGLLKDAPATDVDASSALKLDPAQLVGNSFEARSLKLHPGAKPHGVLWFSRGTWLFDPYHDRGCEASDDRDAVCDRHSVKNLPCLLVQRPKNILRVTTYAELTAFTEEYGSTQLTARSREVEYKLGELKRDSFYTGLVDSGAFTDLQAHITYSRVFRNARDLFDLEPATCATADMYHLRSRLRHMYPGDSLYASTLPDMILEVILQHVQIEYLAKMPEERCKNHGSIDWDRVQAAGYFGVAFDFCSVNDLPDFPAMSPMEQYNVFRWHSGFDVESLCVWDVRAFDNSTYKVNLTIG